MSINQNVDNEVIKERWEVLQAVNHEYGSVEENVISLKHRVYFRLDDYIDNTLYWLEKEEVIISDKPPRGWLGLSIGITIIDEDKLKELYHEYKQNYENIVKQQELSKLGLNVKIFFNNRAGLLQWFSPTDRPVGKLTINSERGKNLVSKLFGNSEVSLKDGITKIWPSKTVNISGIADELKLSEKQTNDTIDQVNRNLESGCAPILIQRSDEAAFITARNL